MFQFWLALFRFLSFRRFLITRRLEKLWKW